MIEIFDHSPAISTIHYRLSKLSISVLEELLNRIVLELVGNRVELSILDGTTPKGVKLRIAKLNGGYRLQFLSCCYSSSTNFPTSSTQPLIIRASLVIIFDCETVNFSLNTISLFRLELRLFQHILQRKKIL